MLLTKIYEVCDAWKYIPNATRSSGLNIAVPQNGSVSFKMNHKTFTQGGGGCSVNLEDSSHKYFIGNWASANNNGLLIRNIGSISNLFSLIPVSTIQADTEHYIEATWNNGVWTYTIDTETITGNANYTPTKLTAIEVRPDGGGTAPDGSYLIDLIIKPL